LINQDGPGRNNTAKGLFFYGYIVAAAGFTVWMIGFGISLTFGIFYKPMLTEFGWARADTVFAYSLGTFMMAVLAIVTGWLTDKLGPRIVVTIFGSFLGISYLLMSKVSALWQFYLYYGVLASIGLSITATPIMATIARWFVRRRSFMTGIVQAGLGIGGLIIAPLTGWLISNYGWRTAYWVLGVIAILGLVISGLFMKRDPEDAGQFPDGVSEPPDPKIQPSQQKSLNPNNVLLKIIVTRRFWIIIGLYSIFGFCRSTFLAHIAAHVQDVGLSLADASHVIAVLMVSSIAGRVGLGRAADAIGNKIAFMMSYAATALSLIWVLVVGELWGFYLFAFIFGVGWGGQAVLRFSITAEAFGLVSLGFIMGILGLGEAFASALGSYWAGLVFDFSGDYLPAFWAGIVLSILGIILVGFVRSRTDRTTNLHSFSLM
jgi:MFS family permease